MSKSVISRMLGDDYQALYFWSKACNIFHSHSKIKSVSYEYDASKSFDDVVLEYQAPIPDERGRLIHADYYQIKFHVTQNGAIESSSLINPAFINAESVSFLQRLKSAVELEKAQGKECRCFLVTPWSIAAQDPLAELVSNIGGELRLDKLMVGKTDGSRMGKIRKMWREHLQLDNDDELINVLESLRIYPNSGSMNMLCDQLNIQLISAGLMPIDVGSTTHKYVDLVQGLLKKSRFTFTRDELLEWCRSEGLYTERKQVESGLLTKLGIRSFPRWADNMENETDAMVCFAKYFDGRYLKDNFSWQSDIVPALIDFLRANVSTERAYNIELDTHSTIVFAAGYELDVKCGVDIAPIQRSFTTGKQVWRPTDKSLIGNYNDWTYVEQSIDKGSDVAIAISATHDVSDDVAYYIEQTGLPIGRMITCYINGRGPGATSIADANHAFFLANRISTKMKSRSVKERMGHLHIFYSGPNGLIFFIGQLSKSFGACTMYEYDFTKQTPGGYQPTITFPY
ncbi:SAVED domain-containing protein [Paenibacillus sanguinis]|uniref:SAVED domain-containing protein n=1 Tax=Paenibacillus sanguinis TaxID=225906 RepID=UPI00036C8B87|nr:SAVED domain-containing protein [Paenibacillus sanguinis]